MKKKLIFTFIFLVLITASTINVALAYSGSSYTSNSSLATKLDNLFEGKVAIFTNTSKKFPLGSNIGTDEEASYKWNNDSGSECYAYANAAYYYLFGDSIGHADGTLNYSKKISGVKASDCLSYEMLAYAGVGCGAYIRTTPNSSGVYMPDSSHSMILLSYNPDNITYLHAAGDHRTVQITTESWANFNKTRVYGAGRYICHIVQPNMTEIASPIPSSTTLEFRNVVYPDQYGIKDSGGFSLQGGYIISDADLASIEARIEDSDGNNISSGSLNLVGKVFSISCLDGRGKDMGQKFSRLNSLGANKSYKWILTAKDKNGRELPLIMNFTTIDASTHSTKAVSKRFGEETTDYTSTPENSLYVFTLDGTATARSTPYSVGAEGNTYVKGKTIKIIARVINKYGNPWYQAEDGYFIYSGDVSLVYTVTSSTEKNYTITQTTDSSNYPYDSSSLPLVLYCKNSYTTGSTITAVKTVKNNLNEIWYQLPDGSFIRADRCQEAATQATLNISGAAYPSGKRDKGVSMTLKGTITSNEKITEIVGSLYDSNTNTLVDKNIFSTKTNPCIVTPNATSYNLNSTAFDRQIKIGELPDGAFRYEVKATTVSGFTKVLINSEFTVGTGVQPVLPSSIFIGPYTIVHPDNRDFTLYIGETKTLTIEYSPENVTKKDVEWVISDPSIATIDQNGNVTAKAIGTAQITVISKYASDVFDVCVVYVDCMHENVTYYETVPPTCTEPGQYEYRCNLCGQWRRRGEISPSGHAYGNWTVTTAATCTENGVETVFCTVCSQALKTRSVEKIPHSFGSWTVTTAATCVASGVETRTCSVCGYAETRSIAVVPHTRGNWTVTTAANCTETGVETEVCTVCGQALDTRSIAALEHDYVWVTVKEATLSEDGQEQFKCSKCGTVAETKIIPAPVTPVNAPDFVIPSAMTIIEEEAFSGIAAKRVKVPAGVSRIGSKAFANCPNLKGIYFVSSETYIPSDAFSGVTGLTIYAPAGSFAEYFAQKYGYTFVAVP